MREAKTPGRWTGSESQDRKRKEETEAEGLPWALLGAGISVLIRGLKTRKTWAGSGKRGRSETRALPPKFVLCNPTHLWGSLTKTCGLGREGEFVRKRGKRAGPQEAMAFQVGAEKLEAKRESVRPREVNVLAKRAQR